MSVDTPLKTETEQLHELFEREWEWTLREYPTFATFVGDRRYNDRWPDESPESYDRRRAHMREVLGALTSIDREKLSATDKLNRDLFAHLVESAVEGERFREEYFPINQMQGLQQDVANLIQLTPLASTKDFEDLITRLESFAPVVDQTIDLMRRGLESGITPPQITLRDVPAQIESQIVGDPHDAPIYRLAFARFPASVSKADQERLKKEGADALARRVIPAYRKLAEFFTGEYLPKTRESIALSDLPEGRDWYRYRAKVTTTTDLSPDEIHDIGLSEVARIRDEMVRVKEGTEFDGDMEAFFRFLRSDPRFFFTEKEALLVAYRDIAKRIDPELPRLFGKLPRLPYGVLPVPEYAEKSQTTAYYYPGSVDAGRPGYFFANTYDLPSRPRWEMEALTLHEAVPGHHLQLALAGEMENVPEFRRHDTGNTAYVEGWGLYAESLGEELGLYRDPYAKFGRLTYEIWRAIRLVVDTGMHWKGWSRQQAIDYFVENAGKASHDIEVEIDRYIVWPGQALAYKIGELKFQELRRRASSTLGDRFDIRAFHDFVLGSGALPLDILESRAGEWLEAHSRPE
ncbi:MAG: DUF885 domain-containing protein [Thermoanaerobaculia bacterium]